MLDSKGRLFGKINIVDLIVLIVIVGVVAAIIVYIAKNGNPIPGSSAAAEDKVCYVTVSCRSKPENCFLSMHEGDQLIAKNNFVEGEIYSVTYGPSVFVGPDAEGNLVQTTHPIWKDGIVVIKSHGNPNNPIFKVGTQEARIGMVIFVKTKNVEMTGSVDSIVWED